MNKFIKVSLAHPQNSLARIPQHSILSSFFQEKELDPECRKLELDTFLSQPWQRMMHYPLLFQNILKKSLEDHPDQANLAQVIKRLNDIISRVNGYTESVQSSKIFEELNHCISSVSKHKAAVRSFYSVFHNPRKYREPVVV